MFPTAFVSRWIHLIILQALCNVNFDWMTQQDLQLLYTCM